VVPLPVIHFVVDSQMISAPCSIGRQQYGVANVLSTTSGTACSWAIAASRSKSGVTSEGFAIVSTWTNAVSPSIASAYASYSSVSTSRVSIPRRSATLVRYAAVPPYISELATTLSPALARTVVIASNAAIPEPVATASDPPSRSASRSSKTFTVGFESRE